MRNQIAKSIKNCALILGIIGCIASVLIAWDKNDGLFSFIYLAIGIFISVLAALSIAAVGELIEVIQQGFYEINKTQAETRNVLFMIHNELESKTKDKRN